MIAKVVKRAALRRGQSAAAATVGSGRRLMAYLLGRGDQDKASMTPAGAAGRGPVGEVLAGGEDGELLARGWDLGRRGNKHTQPRVVAAWDEVRERRWARACAGVDWSDPGAAWLELGELAGEIAGSATEVVDHVRGQLSENAVWHTIMAANPADGTLSDAQWGQVARRVMHETGLAKQGEQNPVRWVAVRHGLNAAGADHIHIVAVLVRRDGSKASTHNDVFGAQRAARWAEQEFSLVPGKGRTKPDQARADVRADRPAARAEMSQAANAGPPYRRPEGMADEAWARLCSEGRDRMWTRQGRTRSAVLSAAARAVSTDHLVALLAEGGYQVRLRYSVKDPSQVTGWSVVAPSLGKGQKPKAYRGSALGSDCTWPAIRAHIDRLAAARGTGVVGETEAEAMIGREKLIAAGWGEEMIARVVQADISLGEGSADPATAYWLRDAFWQLAWKLEGSQGKHGLFTDAAYLYSCVAASDGIPAVPAELTAAMSRLRAWYSQAADRLDQMAANRQALATEERQWQRWTAALDAQADSDERRSRPHLPVYLAGSGGRSMVGTSFAMVGMSTARIAAHRAALRQAQDGWAKAKARSAQRTEILDAEIAEAEQIRQWIAQAKTYEASLAEEIATYQTADRQWRQAVGRLLADARRTGDHDTEARIGAVDQRFTERLAHTGARG